MKTRRIVLWTVIVIILISWFVFVWLSITHTINPKDSFRADFPKRSVTLTYTAQPPLIINTAVPTVTVTMTPTSTLTATPIPIGIGEVQTIGYSVESRPIEVARFGQGPNAVMIVAGVHGGYELNTVVLADELIEYIKGDLSIIPEDKTLYILRAINIDGYENYVGPDGRANAHGVDINRNFDADWQESWYGKNCWYLRPLSAGTAPGSEPETQAVMNFLTEKEIRALISYHSAGLGIFSGGAPNDIQSEKLAYALSAVSGYSYPPIPTECEYTGQLANWASLHGITAVDVELRNHTDTDLEKNIRILTVFLNSKYE